jgi:hypothetical protein
MEASYLDDAGDKPDLRHGVRLHLRIHDLPLESPWGASIIKEKEKKKANFTHIYRIAPLSGVNLTRRRSRG